MTHALPPSDAADPACPTAPATATLSARSARILAESPAGAFRRGVVQALPFVLVLVPFALLFGVVAQGAGLDIAQTMGFSVLVLAGASQFTAVQLMADHTPAILVVISALAVNLRMAMYSASLVPWLGGASGWQRAAIAYLLIDQDYALSIQHYEANPRLSMAQRVSFFMGVAVVLCPPWVVITYLGATVGNVIPKDWPLDFAIPITFLAMVAPMLRTRAHLAAALTAVVAALALAGMPSGTGLLAASALGMAAGAWVETRQTRQRIRSRG